MTHADAFLQDILAHPDDDAPRLIFADWLEEQGDAGSLARAEFIRVQCALAGGELPPQRRAELETRQPEMLKEWGKEWVDPIRRLLCTWEFHRGFIDAVTVWTEEFLWCADELFRQVPIQHVRLSPGVAPIVPIVPHRRNPQRLNMPVLADSVHLRRLRSLDLRDNRLESRDLRALVVSNHLSGLTSLGLASNRIGDSGIRSLAEAPILGQLTHLDLRKNDIGPAGVRALARSLLRMAHSPDGLRLRMVKLQSNNLGTAGQRILADSPLLRRLVRW